MKNKALIIILSAPSGGGKTSIAKKLLEEDDKLSLSVSATTRSPRPGEVEGVHYFFKSKSDFDQMIDDNHILETAEIYRNSYGTPLFAVEEKLAKNLDVLFDIDSQGAYQIMKKSRDQVVSIFITPPDLDSLESRLKLRAQDSQEIIDRRLNLAQEEIKQATQYDYTVVNDDFDRAVKEIQSIIKEERKQREKQ
ncbi:MAG: guanylate kinase [Rickettsiaceae bacterium]|nr:guanylate kinase [Rickettsiaceae bacterium]